MTTAAPRGKRHADCLEHIRHDYARTGWLCIASAEPGRADAMRAFVDHLAEVAARYHARELERPAPIVTAKARKAAARPYRPAVSTMSDCLMPHECDAVRAALGIDDAGWSGGPRGKVRMSYMVPGPNYPYRTDGHCVSCAWIPPERPTVEYPIETAYGPSTRREPLIGPYPAELDAIRPSLPPEAFLPRTDPGRREPAGRATDEPGIIDVTRRKSPRKSRPATLAPEPVREPIAELARDLIETGRALGILPRPAGYIDPAPSGPESFSLAGVTIITADGTTTGTLTADEHGDIIIPDGPAVVDLAYSAETADGLEPASIAEPARPEPEPVRVPLAIVPPADDRPSCARCGQTFRRSGVGLEWHVKNRPDCAGRAAREEATA